jgi:hypothetical protein
MGESRLYRRITVSPYDFAKMIFTVVTIGLDLVVHADPSILHGLPDQVRQ